VTLFARFSKHIDDALAALVASGSLSDGLNHANVTVEPPRDPAHGDLSTNAAMVLAKPAGMNPRALAELLSGELAKIDGVKAVEIAGPGFLNLRLDPALWYAELADIAAQADDYGRSDIGKGRLVNVEYVSANPTGPMHMGRRGCW
jgi:arginyl-tRNA synthetase